jgi:hypothetical protein
MVEIVLAPVGTVGVDVYLSCVTTSVTGSIHVIIVNMCFLICKQIGMFAGSIVPVIAIIRAPRIRIGMLMLKARRQGSDANQKQN